MAAPTVTYESQLFEAIAQNDLAKVIVLAHAGANMKATDEQGRDTDDVASLGPKGPMREALWLLGARASPIFVAATYDLTAVAEQLVSMGAKDVDNLVFGASSAHHAVRHGNLKMIELLGKAGANLDMEGGNGYSPLSLAIWFEELKEEQRLPLVEALLAAGAKPNVKGRKGFAPLHHAAWRNNVPVLEALLKAGANVNITTWAYDTPLKIADGCKHTEAVQALIAAGGKKSVPKTEEDLKREAAEKAAEEEAKKEAAKKTEEAAINAIMAKAMAAQQQRK